MNAQAQQLITQLQRGGAYGYWWTAEGKRSTWWGAQEPAEVPGGRKNVYFGVHPVAAIPETNARGEHVESSAVRSQIAAIGAVNCFFAEFDAKDFDHDKTATLAAIDALDPPPSAVVDSGGGYHCYWLLDEPQAIATDAARAELVKLQAAWVKLMGSDPASKDLARVLRVPGTTNYKYDPPRPVELLRLTERRYTYTELADIAAPFVETGRAAPASGSPTERYAQAALAGELARVITAPDGQKHHQLYKSAAALGELAATGALDESQVKDLLLNAITPRAADVRGAADTIRDGVAKGMTNPRKIPERRGAPTTEYVVPEGGELPESALIIEKMRILGYTFRLNLCSDSVEVNGTKISDITAAEIRMKLRDVGLGKKLAAAEDAYMAEAKKNAYHPIRDYLCGLVWDKEDHISELAGYMTSNDPPIVYADGAEVPLHGVYLYRWLIGAVAKAMDAHQNAMLVLDGPQGVGKSTFARWLCSGIPDYFIEGPIATTDKDTDVRLIDKWIWEVSELDATTRKQDQSAIKAFVTKREVTVRKSYGRHDITKPALASLVGTVNNTSGFLADESGSRRFFITRVEYIDRAYERIDVNQLWAQAVALYQEGERWQLVGEEKQAQNARNEGYEVESVLEDWLEKYFTFDPAYDDPYSLADIIGELYRADVRVSGSERSQAMELARILTRKGARKIETRNGKRWVGIFRKPS